MILLRNARDAAVNHTTLRPLVPIAMASLILLSGAVAGTSVQSVDAKKPTPAADAPAPDATAPILERLQKAIGDSAALAKVARIEFHLVIGAGDKVSAERKERVDLEHSLARVDLPVKTGDVACAISTTSDAFRVQQGGTAVEGKDAAAIHKRVVDTFRSDWNYLTLPQRLTEKSFSVKLDGEIEIEKKMCDRLAITTQEDPKAPPGDRYWLLVDRESGMPRSLLVKWRTMDAKQKPLRFDYAEWTTLSGVKLPARLNGVGNPQVLKFKDLRVPAEFEGTVFLGVEKGS